MSVIFQSSPPSVIIHPLPRNSHFISYKVRDLLTLSAWMPDKFATVSQTYSNTNDDFFDEFCRHCERNRLSFLDNIVDPEDWFDVEGGESGHCHVYDDGYHGQNCPMGYTLANRDIYFEISNMVFEISVNHLGELPRYERQSDSAFLRGGVVLDQGVIQHTRTKIASNVYGSDTSPGGICWGLNEIPTNLREIVTDYLSTPYNNDLLRVEQFQRNCHSIRYAVERFSHEEVVKITSKDDTFLCYGEFDAVAIVDAEQHVPAFFTLLTAGFKSLHQAPHVMLVPAKEHSLEMGDSTLWGYATIPDDVGKSWFISNDGRLVGQL